MAGFHEVRAPQLGRPGATPPPPPPVVPRYEVPEVNVNGFKPILGPRIPIQRRRQPESLDYGTDIITIYDVKPKGNDTMLRTVSSSLQVKREDPDEKRAGRVYEDVIYDLPVETQDFRPEESSHELKAEKQQQPHDRLKGWRRIA